MKFIPIICCLFILSGCSEKRKDKIVIEKKSCIHFTQHSRQLPIVNSAIEIFEGQQFDGVLELKNDSVHYILQPDSNLLEPPKVLVFIDQEEVAPYRELISQQLPSGGYWIYYACYDSLGNECFLPEFYDVDQVSIPYHFCMPVYSPNQTFYISQLPSNKIVLDYNYFDSLNPDTLMLILTKDMESYNQAYLKVIDLHNFRNQKYKWLDTSILKAIYNLHPSIQIKAKPIDFDIRYANEHITWGDTLPPLNEVKYETNYAQNLILKNYIYQAQNIVLQNIKSKNSFTSETYKQLTEEEIQQLPFLLTSPSVFKYYNYAKWRLGPPPPPPINRTSCPINP
ncbi:MAG: hypothetical protein ACI9N1_000296 [Flavobacteriales bacterium]